MPKSGEGKTGGTIIGTQVCLQGRIQDLCVPSSLCHEILYFHDKLTFLYAVFKSFPIIFAYYIFL